MEKNTTKTKKSKSTTSQTIEVQEKPFDFFRFVDDISYGKKNLFNDETQQHYNSFLIVKALSMHVDCVIDANDMNLYYDLPKDMQHDFLINSIRPRKRYGKWPKAEKNADLDAIKEYYKYNDAKARSALSILGKKEIDIIFII